MVLPLGLRGYAIVFRDYPMAYRTDSTIDLNTYWKATVHCLLK